MVMQLGKYKEAEEDGEESELFFLRVVVVPLEVVVATAAAAALVDTAGIVELIGAAIVELASLWVEDAGAGSTTTALIPSSPPRSSPSPSVVDASLTFTLPNSSRRVAPILEALLGASEVCSVVLFIVVSSATSSSAAAAAAMVKIRITDKYVRTEAG